MCLLQKRIIFLFFEPVRRARTFFVPRAHVTRNRLAQRFRFRAFERDDFLRHVLIPCSVVPAGFFFFAVAAFLIRQAKERSDRLANA